VRQKSEIGMLAGIFNVMVARFKETHERNSAISYIKSQFVSVAAHQLRTPLSTLKWAIRNILDGDAGPLTAEQERYLEKGYETNERMIYLVDDLLNVSRIEEGRFGFIFETVNIAKLAREATQLMSLEAKKWNIEIVLDISMSKQTTIVADPDRIRMVMVNILDNAVRYAWEGSRVTMQIVKKGSSIEVRITNEGIGISKNEIDKIFSKFYRSPNAVKYRTSGSGLGLFIAKNIINRHGGKIWLTSKDHGGTTIFFNLPLKLTGLPASSALEKEIL